MIRMSAKKAAAHGIRIKRPAAPVKPKSPPRRKKGVSELEESFVGQVARAGLLVADREYRFAPPRRWRFDFAWPDRRIAVEIEGGVWTEGGHTRGAAYVKNLEKYNEAVLAGWRLFRFHEGTIKDGSAVKFMAPMLRRTIYSPEII